MNNEQWAWHVHHRILVEQLRGQDGLAERQDYIREEKPHKERARRLRLLKVVKSQELINNLKVDSQTAYDLLPNDVRKVIRRGLTRAINALHAHECKRCPWNGKTIFPRKKVK